MVAGGLYMVVGVEKTQPILPQTVSRQVVSTSHGLLMGECDLCNIINRTVREVIYGPAQEAINQHFRVRKK